MRVDSFNKTPFSRHNINPEEECEIIDLAFQSYPPQVAILHVRRVSDGLTFKFRYCDSRASAADVINMPCHLFLSLLSFVKTAGIFCPYFLLICFC